MLKSLSLKTKMIIFIILSLVGIYIIVNTAIENRRQQAMLKSEYEAKIKDMEEEKASQEQERKKLDEEQKAKQEEQKKVEENKKALEEKYNAAYDAFFGKKYTDAANLADEIINDDPQFYKAYNIKGIALCYSGKFDEGMKNIDKSLELKQDFGYGRFNKALAFELFGHYDESLAWYDKALEVEDYVWSYYGKASIYGRRGDVQNTVKYLKVAIEKEPNVKGIAADEEDFNNVRNSKEFKELIK